MILTKEQELIISKGKEGLDLKINAYAGTGKTSTLVALAKAIPKSALYLTFNKKMVEEAKDRFPDYVDVRTWHSLAYRGFGVQFAHKLKRPMGAYVNACTTGREIAQALKLKNLVINEDKYISAAAMGLAVKRTVGRYEYSDDVDILKKHIDYTATDKFNKNGKFINGFPKKTYDRIILDAAKKFWLKRLDKNDPTVITHDTYLKLYQLSNPCLDEYDIIYCDESQDSSDVMIDILMKQKAQKIVVGDARQQIYSFRGSVNAMKKIKGMCNLSLTKSFRFGVAVAEVASKIIRSELTGFEEINSVVHNVGEGDSDLRGHTIIYRSNSTMLFDACRFVIEGYKVNVEADVKSVGNLLRSAVALQQGDMKSVKAEEFSLYNSWEEFEEECKLGKTDLQHIYSIVKTGRAMEVIGFTLSYKKSDNPDIVLTTAHKTKGLEWNHVILADDFPTKRERQTKEEENLLYVAATRGKYSLTLNTYLSELLEERNFSSPVVVKEAYILSGQQGLDALPLIEKKMRDKDLDVLLQSEHVDEQIQMGYEDGMTIDDIPEEIKFMPSPYMRV